MAKNIQLSKVYPLGRFAGLKFSAKQSTIVAFLILWAALALISILVIRLPILGGIVGGLLSALLHYVASLWHHLGHATSARLTGYPMSGVLFWGLLATSIYPPKERKLPPQVHIRRALGGPVASALMSLVAAILVLILRPVGGSIWWVAIFFFLDNLLVFTLGALIPLGFTDGSTLLHWSKQRKVKV